MVIALKRSSKALGFVEVIALMDTRKHFESSDSLYIPSANQSPSRWAKCADCVWSAPSFVKTKVILGNISEYSQLEQFLSKILRISNIEPHDILSCPKDSRNGGERPRGEVIQDIYYYLYREFRHDSQWSLLR